jgi:hypothetical protein
MGHNFPDTKLASQSRICRKAIFTPVNPSPRHQRRQWGF